MIRPRTLRSSLILFSFLILLILTMATLYSTLATSELSRSVERLFQNNLSIRQVGASLDRTGAALTEYLRTKDSEALNLLIEESSQLKALAQGLNSRPVDSQALLLQKNIYSMAGRYLAQTEAAIAAKRGRDVKNYTRLYEDSRVTAAGIRDLQNKLQGLYLDGSLAAFSSYNEVMPNVVYTNALMLLSAFLFTFLLLVRFTYRITDPLIHLARAAEAVGRGDYDTPYLFPPSTDEVRATAEAFQVMRENIRQAFTDMTHKAVLEKRLLNEEMKGILMSHQLKEAELLALQTQINPHFLYNTLSAGLQLAWSENADKTADFLENLGAFIRYVLKNPSRMVPVAEEVECVSRYITLMELRFGDRYKFSLDVDPRTLEAPIPALILQPLIENSINHGLKDREEGGEIAISVRRETVPDRVELSVRDNGAGMSPEESSRLLYETQQPSVDNSIGLRNVIRRIWIATGGQGGVKLLCPAGGGLDVRVELPWTGSGE